MVSRSTGTVTEPKAGKVNARILIIEAPYYEGVSRELLAGATAELDAWGATYDKVTVVGALEIPQALAQAVEAGLVPATASSARYAGAILLGCVIRGETSHYDIVVNNANHWLYHLAITHRIPVGNAILTVDTEAQAMARALGGRHGKGGDAARACLGLIQIGHTMQGMGA
jgi:6,7-dimethyl-8-ribityllumazine synthase